MQAQKELTKKELKKLKEEERVRLLKFLKKHTLNFSVSGDEVKCTLEKGLELKFSGRGDKYIIETIAGILL